MAFSRDRTKPRRSWARRALLGVNILLATLLILGVAGVGYAKWRYGQVPKLNLNSVLSENDDGQVMNVLLVGSDSRADLTPEDRKKYGNTGAVAGQRSDTIMVLHIDPKAQSAAILSFPRDLWVPIADTGGKQRINTAFDKGPEQLIKTIRQDFNIPIEHYAQVDFEGFKGMVNALNGVQIPFSAPARDYDPDTGKNLSGLDIKSAGCITLNGDQALSYVRSRHYQSYEGGRWRSDPRSDLGRIDRQQDFIRRVMHKAVDNAKNPLTLNSLIATGVKNVQVDEGFGMTDIAKLAQRFKSLDPSKVEMMTIPATGTSINGASVLLPKQPEADQTVQRFLHGSEQQADGAPPVIAAGSISVRILNGSGTPGQASEASGSLKDAGFVIAGVGDATARPAATTIRYATGNADKAATIAKYIKGGSTSIEDKTLKGVDAVITTGASFEGVNMPGEEPASTTTSSTPPTTAKSKFVPSAEDVC